MEAEAPGQGERTRAVPAAPPEPERPGAPRDRLAQCRDGPDDYDGPVPPYVEREFRRYLACGILAHGFARAPL